MEKLIFTQLSIPEVRDLFRQELEACFEKHNHPGSFQPEIQDELLIVPEAAEFLHLAKATVYSLNHQGKLPSMKLGKRLYFSKSELINYLKQGRKKTAADRALETDQYLTNLKKKGGRP